jgi:hypothetical protein
MKSEEVDNTCNCLNLSKRDSLFTKLKSRTDLLQSQAFWHTVKDRYMVVHVVKENTLRQRLSARLEAWRVLQASVTDAISRDVK